MLGQQLRNGFQLAVKTLGGKLGGREVEMIVQDDELKPDVAVTKVKALVERDKVDFVVGPIFSNILQAIMKPATEGGAFLISPNAGTSNFAGKDCNPNFFVTSYQNDQNHEVLGQVRAGRRHARKSSSWRRTIRPARTRSPASSATSRARSSTRSTCRSTSSTTRPSWRRSPRPQPDAIFVFLPGGMGVNFVKQFRQAGLADKIKFLSAFTVDESTLPAQQDAALGFFGGANWAPNLDNPQNKAFVAAYEKEYNAVPATYAFQAYDAALLIDSALKATKGNTSNKDALRAAMMKADFKSLRGGFKFNTNHYPVQDFYLVKVAKRADGKFETEIVEKVFDELRRSARQGLPDEIDALTRPSTSDERRGNAVATRLREARAWRGRLSARASPRRSPKRGRGSGECHRNVHHPPHRPDPQRAAARRAAVPDRRRADARVRRDGLHQPGAWRAVHAGRLFRGDVLRR